MSAHYALLRGGGEGSFEGLSFGGEERWSDEPLIGRRAREHASAIFRKM